MDAINLVQMQLLCQAKELAATILRISSTLPNGELEQILLSSAF